MSKRTTLQDVADHCKVSKSLVAQVLRDPEHCKAAAATRALILNAAGKLDYHRNLAAQSLRTNRSYAVGVLFPAVSSFYTELTFRLDEALARRGYYGLFSYWDAFEAPEEGFRRAFLRMKHRGVDGIISCQRDPMLEQERLPVVIYGNELQTLDCVYPDKLDYAVRAVRYLYECGHRNIGCIGYFPDPRYAGLRAEMRRLDLAVEERWMIDSAAFLPNGYEAFRRLPPDDLPTALIAHSDHVAMGILRGAAERGIRVPEELSVLSYDNLPESAYCTPPLTTFDQCYRSAADALVELLLNRIANPGLPQQKRGFVMPLVERKSVLASRPR